VTELLNKNADPNEPVPDSAYHQAALRGDSRAITAFLSKVQPNYAALDSSGRSVVLCALLNGKANIVKVLVHPAAPDLAAPFEPIVDTILAADDSEAADIAACLIDKGLPVQSTDSEGGGFLMGAIKRKKAALAELLISKGALGDEDLEPFAIEAVLLDLPRVVKQLVDLQANFDVIHKNWQLFHYCVKHETDETLHAMLPGNDILKELVDMNGNTFIHRAAFAGSLRSLRIAIDEFNSDINVRNKSNDVPLVFLIQEITDPAVFRECCEYLLDSGAAISNLNDRGQNVLHVAADSPSPTAAEVFLELLPPEIVDGLLQETDGSELTPLEVASKHRSLTVATVFNKICLLPIVSLPLIDSSALSAHLAKGLSPDVANASGTPLLSILIQQESDPDLKLDCVTSLLKAGADPSRPDAEGLTPLHHAIRASNKDILLALINSGASFIVEPVIRTFAEKEDREDMLQYTSEPEKRASAVHEFLETQRNTLGSLRAILTFEDRFKSAKEELTMCLYLDEVKKMNRILQMFVNRLGEKFSKMNPQSEFASFFLFFADAFTLLLNIPTLYHKALEQIRANSALAPILSDPINYNNYVLADALIVPVQQLTRYHELVRAILKATPRDHGDWGPLQKAHVKYSNLGRAANERMLIAESQEKLKMIHLFTSVHSREIPYEPNDVLLIHGQFEKKNFVEPARGKELFAAQEWGLVACEIPMGALKVHYFAAFDRGAKSFMKAQKLGIFLFSKIVLFVNQERENRFKIKFACRCCETHWDFSREYGSDTFVIWTPIGQLLVKVDPSKGSSADFEKTQWKQNLEKFGVIDETEEATPGECEVVHVTWVGKGCPSVLSKLFCVQCSSKTQAKEFIKKYLEEKEVPIETKANPTGSRDPLINFEFQTFRPSQNQKSDILSDFELT
jgi:ankyrin repeat protein